MKTPNERGPYGRWLVAARLARDLATAEEARAALQAAGITIAKSTYAEYEAGKPVSKNHLPELERFFGEFKDPLEGQGDDSLAAAIREQAAAIRDLVEELRLSRAGQVAATEVAFRALGALGATQDRQGTQNDSGHEAPAGTPR